MVSLTFYLSSFTLALPFHPQTPNLATHHAFYDNKINLNIIVWIGILFDCLLWFYDVHVVVVVLPYYVWNLNGIAETTVGNQHIHSMRRRKRRNFFLWLLLIFTVTMFTEHLNPKRIKSAKARNGSHSPILPEMKLYSGETFAVDFYFISIHIQRKTFVCCHRMCVCERVSE